MYREKKSMEKIFDCLKVELVKFVHPVNRWESRNTDVKEISGNQKRSRAKHDIHDNHWENNKTRQNCCLKSKSNVDIFLKLELYSYEWNTHVCPHDPHSSKL